MRGSKHFIVLIASMIFLLGITAPIIPIKAQPPVRVYVDQPEGYLPFVAPGTKFTFYVKIATSGIADGTTAGIIMWKMDMQVDPNVLDINTTMGGGFPPAPAKASFSTGEGHFLYEFAAMMGYSPPTLLLGTNDPTTGYQDEITESGVPSYPTGAGDYVSGLYPKLLTVEITSKSDTQGCLIDLIDVMYRTGDGLWHNAEQVEDGYYGTPPTFVSETADPFDPKAPIGSRWHELWPHYSNYMTLDSWEDNGDGILSASDQIDMTNETDGWIYWWHVGAVTVTIHWTFKTPDIGTGDAEPVEPHILGDPIRDPTGTRWHQLYPEFSRAFEITSWEDTDGGGTFTPSDQFDFVYDDEPGVIHWAHLDRVSTDIILSFKSKEPPVIPEFPLGLGLMIALAPAVPIIYLWRTRKKVVSK